MSDLVAATAAAMLPEADLRTDEVVAQMLREIPELGGDRVLEDLLRTSVGDNVRSGLERFARGEVAPGQDAPASAIAYARLLAQRGVPVSSLLRAYRLGQAAFQERVLAGIARSGADAETVLRVTIELTTASFTYIDGLAEQVVRVHQAERDAWVQRRSAARAATVAALVGGGPVDVDRAEQELGHPLRGTHVGVAAWYDAGTDDPLPRLERAVTRLAQRAGCARAPLVLPADGWTVHAWLPSPGPLVWENDGPWLAVGDPAAGVDGFRRTHQQARQAASVALAVPPARRARLTTAADVGLVALLRADPVALRDWVRAVLGDLAIDDEPHARLRETARVWLTHQGSHTGAAAELLLHRNTVQYRVRRAEAARGRPLSERRLDVEVALRACHLLGSAVLG
ncbi:MULTISPECIES: helix-turn-helix domain-containing protein [unclassified Nocardioides]|uniref:helix-turn-helix domain-containing protein n=1 Tax=unclassified Nocardioides TaxID=2615069 RepID=UPI003015243D